MRNNQTLLRRHLLAAALAATIALPAVAAAAAYDDPARIVVVSGYVAEKVIETYEPAVPVMVTVVNEQLLAIVFSEDETKNSELLGALFVPGSSQLALDSLSDSQCNPETGVICCETQTGTIVLGATLDQAVGWIRLGEWCKPPSDVTGVDFVPIAQWLSDYLADKLNVYHCWARLPLANRNPRVLVNAPDRDSWEGEYCFRHLAEVDGTAGTLADVPPESTVTWVAPSIPERRLSSRIVLAGHHGTPPLPNCIRSAPPYCNTSQKTDILKLRCHKYSWHWFEKNKNVSYVEWCNTATLGKCTCTSS